MVVWLPSSLVVSELIDVSRACDVLSESAGSSVLGGDVCGDGHLPQFPVQCTAKCCSDLQSEHLIRCVH